MTSTTSESTVSSASTTTSFTAPVFPLYERRLFAASRLPQGLAAVVETLVREVLRQRPDDIYSFAAQHFDHLLESRTNQAKKKTSNQSKRLKHLAGTDSTVPWSSAHRSNIQKTKGSKSGWSIKETSKVLKKNTASYCQNETQIKQSECPKTNCQSPKYLSSSNQNENIPTTIAMVAKSSHLTDTKSPILQEQTDHERSGSFEFGDQPDTHRHREYRDTNPLLRSISLDCILPKRRYSAASDKNVTGRSSSAKEEDRNKKKGTIHLPAVKSPPSSSSSSGTSLSSRTRSKLVANNTLALPVIRQDLPKFAKKCDPVIFPAVSTNASSPEVQLDSEKQDRQEEMKPEDVDHSEERRNVLSSSTSGEGNADDGTIVAIVEGEKVSSEENLRTNELREKLLELQTVERSIERTLALAGIVEGKLEESESNNGIVQLEEVNDLEEETLEVNEDDGKASQLCDAAEVFGDRLNADYSSENIETRSVEPDLYRVPSISEIINTRSELDEIKEEVEEENLEGSKYEESILPQNPSDRVNVKTNIYKENSRMLEDIAENEEKEEKEETEESQIEEISSNVANVQLVDHNIDTSSDEKQMNENFTETENETSNALEGTVEDETIQSDINGKGNGDRNNELADTTSLLPEQEQISLEEQIAKELIENQRLHESGCDPESTITLAKVPQVECTETERSPGEQEPLVFRVLHTGEFHDSIPLPLFETETINSLKKKEEDNFIAENQAHEETTGSQDEVAIGETPSGIEEPGIEKEVPLTSGEVVPLSNEDQLLPSGTFPSEIRLNQPIMLQNIGQDSVALCSLLRAVRTGSGIIELPPIIYSHPFTYQSPSSNPTEMHKFFQTDSINDRPSLTIEEIPVDDNPEKKIEEVETPAIITSSDKLSSEEIPVDDNSEKKIEEVEVSAVATSSDKLSSEEIELTHSSESEDKS